MLHTNILSSEQLDLVDEVARFGKQGFYLVGGTALALQLGHRKSLDFDLFLDKSFQNKRIVSSLKKRFEVGREFVNSRDELTIWVHNMKMTWYHYPYQIPLTASWPGVIKMPDMLTIGAMKAFALGRRNKWKDYVDMYFLLKQFSLQQVVNRAIELFGTEVNDRIFREQLSYFTDMNYRELPEYMPGFEVSEEEVKKTLADIACTE